MGTLTIIPYNYSYTWYTKINMDVQRSHFIKPVHYRKCYTVKIKLL